MLFLIKHKLLKRWCLPYSNKYFNFPIYTGRSKRSHILLQLLCQQIQWRICQSDCLIQLQVVANTEKKFRLERTKPCAGAVVEHTIITSELSLWKLKKRWSKGSQSHKLKWSYQAWEELNLLYSVDELIVQDTQALMCHCNNNQIDTNHTVRYFLLLVQWIKH